LTAVKLVTDSKAAVWRHQMTF